MVKIKVTDVLFKYTIHSCLKPISLLILSSSMALDQTLVFTGAFICRAFRNKFR